MRNRDYSLTIPDYCSSYREFSANYVVYRLIFSKECPYTLKDKSKYLSFWSLDEHPNF